LVVVQGLNKIVHVYNIPPEKLGNKHLKNIILENIFSNLLYILVLFVLKGDFGTQKEAAWAISNLTISGRKDQVSGTLNYISEPAKITV
jgi:hypothetical protein